MPQILQKLIVIWFGWVQHGGLPVVVVLMAMESSVVPVPSEIVIPPAAYMAYQSGSTMGVVWVVLGGTFGSWLGAAISYWVSLWVGRVFIVKFGRYFMVSEKKLEQAEHWLHRYESGGIFFARLLPVIRHLISIPAGIVRMGFGMFSLMTIIGSAIWCTVLAIFGVKVITPDMLDPNHPSLLKDAIKHKSIWIVIGMAVLCVLYFVVLKLTAKPAKPGAAS